MEVKKKRECRAVPGHWDRNQVHDFALRVRAEWGGAWGALSAHVRRALVGDAALSIIRGQFHELRISPRAANDLYFAMLDALGIE